MTGRLMFVLVLAVLSACGDADASDTTGLAQGTVATTGTTATTSATPADTTSSTADGGAATTAPGIDAGSLDACSLLTDDEISSILGEAVAGTPEDMGFDSTCRWEMVDAEGMLSEVVVDLASLDEESAAAEMQTWSEITTVLEDSVPVGDEALLALYSASGSSLIIREGGLLVWISTSVEGQEDEIVGLGQAVLDRIG